MKKCYGSLVCWFLVAFCVVSWFLRSTVSKFPKIHKFKNPFMLEDNDPTCPILHFMSLEDIDLIFKICKSSHFMFLGRCWSHIQDLEILGGSSGLFGPRPFRKKTHLQIPQVCDFRTYSFRNGLGFALHYFEYLGVSEKIMQVLGVVDTSKNLKIMNVKGFMVFCMRIKIGVYFILCPHFQETTLFSDWSEPGATPLAVFSLSKSGELFWTHVSFLDVSQSSFENDAVLSVFGCISGMHAAFL